jgi:hypothetical protein
MLTRQVQAIDVDDANNAPELFWAEPRKPDPDYPLLELHTETTTRRVWAIR